MTDDWDAAAEDGGFGEDFFADLESAPGADTGAADLFGADGADEYFYEAEGDGSFETAASDPADASDPTAPDDFSDADFPFDLDFDVGGEA
ncbi:hypothetical protein [Glycomyces sp. NPDC047010]|uniref:hypothetical protein n=1 Tax=Glycomyces sp. NPDC047010 TaxID=3155023 RepID=UPI0033CAFA6A